jgi:hypothetical protein
VSRFPFGDDSKKSKKNEGNGKDEEQIQGSFTALRVFGTIPLLNSVNGVKRRDWCAKLMILTIAGAWC